jgi:hypothetical protein
MEAIETQAVKQFVIERLSEKLSAGSFYAEVYRRGSPLSLEKMHNTQQEFYRTLDLMLDNPVDDATRKNLERLEKWRNASWEYTLITDTLRAYLRAIR